MRILHIFRNVCCLELVSLPLFSFLFLLHVDLESRSDFHFRFVGAIIYSSYSLFY